MNKGNKKKLNLLAIIPIIVAMALISGVAVFAAYTNLGSVKRVVSTQGIKGTPFSSNYLNLTPEGESTYSTKSITFPESSESITFDINVCNYVHNNPSQYNENTIKYTLSLKLINWDGNSLEGFRITCGENSFSLENGECTITNQILKGKMKSVNTYRITVPKSFVDTVKIEAAAIPDSASYEYTGNYKLCRRFSFTNKTETAKTWSGRFAEGTEPDWDGFNYILSGQGEGEVTLSWDSANLEISSIFLQENSITPSGGSITLSVNSDNKNRYDIQFYKTENGSYPDMGTVDGYVSVSFSET